LIKTAAENGYSMDVLNAVDSVNDKQKEVLYKKVENYFGADNLAGKTVALWGLSFKPQTDDMREAPSLVIIERLLAQGVKVKAYDPVAMEEAKHILGDTIEYYDDEIEALQDADCLMIATEWPNFRFPDFEAMRNAMVNPLIFDGRNVYVREEIEEQGFEYHCMGVKDDKVKVAV